MWNMAGEAFLKPWVINAGREQRPACSSFGALGDSGRKPCQPCSSVAAARQFLLGQLQLSCRNWQGPSTRSSPWRECWWAQPGDKFVCTGGSKSQWWSSHCFLGAFTVMPAFCRRRQRARKPFLYWAIRTSCSSLQVRFPNIGPKGLHRSKPVLYWQMFIPYILGVKTQDQLGLVVQPWNSSSLRGKRI